LHEPSEKRFSLSLDISEIFKPLIVDTVIFKLLNNSKLTLEHFDEDLNYCYLNHEGRKIFLKELQNKLETTVRHRQLNRNVSYKSFIRLECYKLIKHFIGDQVYSPLKAWW
jgi:CRISPR-associated protein Cas1